jgi:hypothetical protein
MHHALKCAGDLFATVLTAMHGHIHTGYHSSELLSPFVPIYDVYACQRCRYQAILSNLLMLLCPTF